ncbi:histidine protein methyltransferase 1 homolog isoform X3 [Dendrobium catenatum]|uniref:histidine protein methyltransferase 1 homolog isoform X3 n=1 Tax=Dendrobium catenatum TaxID=906689 RepID=UPI0010A05D96|nr:histidine protein methyltransferase 1 homolog isoform X3 [Dendrobium catenatum]
MTEENRLSNPKKSYPFFAISNTDQLGPSFGFFGAPQKPPPPLPSCVEVSLFEPEYAIKSHTESIVVCDGDRKVTLLKGRVSTSDVFGVSNSDLVPGKYEGGLKLWEGSIDLVRTLHAEIEEGRLTVEGKRVLETSGNKAEVNMLSTVRFFAGDWSEVHDLLLHGSNDGHQNEEDYCTRDVAYDGYDIILMAETIYEPSSLQHLYELIKKCLCRPKGIVYMAGKKHYFGVGGGTRQFIDLAEVNGQMKTLLLAEVADGSSNVREVWKLSNE